MLKLTNDCRLSQAALKKKKKQYKSMRTKTLKKLTSRVIIFWFFTTFF